MIWFIGNLVWQVGHLGYQSQYDEESYNAKIKAIKSTTLGDAAELIASFIFSCMRDHFVESALKYFMTGMLKRSIIKQINELIEQQKKHHPEKPKNSAGESAAHQGRRVHPKVPKAVLDKISQDFLHELKTVEHLLDERIRGKIKDLDLWHR